MEVERINKLINGTVLILLRGSSQNFKINILLTQLLGKRQKPFQDAKKCSKEKKYSNATLYISINFTFSQLSFNAIFFYNVAPSTIGHTVNVLPIKKKNDTNVFKLQRYQLKVHKR